MPACQPAIKTWKSGKPPSHALRKSDIQLYAATY
jgi:hypothetical protein